MVSEVEGGCVLKFREKSEGGDDAIAQFLRQAKTL